jgi:integrase
MAKANTALDTRRARSQLPARPNALNKPYFDAISKSLHLGYQRPAAQGEAGRWFARQYTGRKNYLVKLLGPADDVEGIEGMSYDSAVALAREAFAAHRVSSGPITLAEAVKNYVATTESKYKVDIARMVACHITGPKAPLDGETPVASLTKTALQLWRAGTVERMVAAKRAAIAAGTARPDSDAEIERKAKDSCNRITATFRAILNNAFDDEANKLTSRPWKNALKSYSKVGRARQQHFTEEQVSALVNASPDRALADLISGGWYTGARYGELCQVRVKHLDLARAVLHVPGGKTGHRDVQLTTEGAVFLGRMCAGRDAEALIFLNAQGQTWNKCMSRPMKTALAAAGLDERASFYTIRHSYISRAIEAGVPQTVIAENCGTSIRMIEENYKHILPSAKRALLEKFAPRVHVAPAVAANAAVHSELAQVRKAA